MRATLKGAASTTLALPVLCGASAAAAQTRKEVADRVVKQYGAPSAACALLSNDEVVRITGQPSYQPLQGTQLTNGGSACDYDSGNLTLFSGPQSAQHYEAYLRNFKRDTLPRTPVAGVGESAVLMIPPAGDRDAGRIAVLVVRQGTHTVATALETMGREAPQSLQPQVGALAKAALAKPSWGQS